MTIELKPCPFCGADAEIDTHQAYRNLSTGRLEDAVAVYCVGECGTQMTRCPPDFPGTSRGDLAAILVDLWNRRAEPPAGYKLVPVEPTTEMIHAGMCPGRGSYELGLIDEDMAEDCYRSMVKAAPKSA